MNLSEFKTSIPAVIIRKPMFFMYSGGIEVNEFVIRLISEMQFGDDPYLTETGKIGK